MVQHSKKIVSATKQKTRNRKTFNYFFKSIHPLAVAAKKKKKECFIKFDPWDILLSWPIYTIMNSSPLINTTQFTLWEISPSRVVSMHCSLEINGLRHTTVGSISRYVDLVWCVVASVAFDRGGPWPVSSRLKGPSPQALSILGVVRIIAWRFWGEGWRGQRHIWSRQTCLGYGPAPDSPKKKTLSHTLPVGEKTANPDFFPEQSWDTPRSVA